MHAGVVEVSSIAGNPYVDRCMSVLYRSALVKGANCSWLNGLPKSSLRVIFIADPRVLYRSARGLFNESAIRRR